MNAQPAVDFNLATLPPQGDRLLQELNRLRESDPLYWSEASQCWIVTGHAEVMEGLSGTLQLSSTHIPMSLYRTVGPEEFPQRLPNTLRYMSRILPNLDGDDHARIRKLLIKAFSRKVVEEVRPFVRERVARLLDMAANQRALEFNEGIARQLPGAVILRLLGMDDRYFSRLQGWTNAVTLALTSFNPQVQWLDELEKAVIDMNNVFRAEIEQRRRHPGNDLTSAMVHAVDGGDRLSMDEMLGAMNLIIVAGHDTTLNSMSLGVRALARHPEAWAEWRAHPERGVEASIELMRYVAMATALPRIVSRDFEWRGRQLRQHQLVILTMAGGNRDPRAFDAPEKLDLSRPNDNSLTFGPGLHHCIGHMLAKMQMSEFFGALTQQFDGVEILEEPQFLHNFVFRGVSGLKLRFLPRIS